MNKRHAHVIVIGVFVILLGAIGSAIFRHADAWTDPGNTPPYASPSIITSGGNVGIGGAPGTYKLNVNGDANATRICIAGNCQGSWPASGLGGSGSANYIPKFTTGTTLGNSTIYDNGNIGIGTASPGVKLEVAGSVRGNQAGALRVDTGNGYVDIGPQNASWSHFQTDRPNFYFNKGVYIDGGLGGYSGATGGTYGSLSVYGSKNGWAGFNFPGNGTLMMNGGTSGFFNAADTGWRWNVSDTGLEQNYGGVNYIQANPYLSASSYMIIPGGAYFSSGTVYAEAPIQARGGLHNDTGSYLTLQGGTTGKTQLTGALRFSDGTEQTTAGGSTVVYASVTASAADWFTGALSPYCTQYNNGGYYYGCSTYALASIPAGRNYACFLNSVEFDDRYGPTFGVNATLQRPACSISNNQITASLFFMSTTPDRYDQVSCAMKCIVF